MWFISRSRRNDIKTVLKECCALQTPASIQLYEGRVLAQARFSQFASGELRMVLYDVPEAGPELAGSLACVSFHHGRRSAVFLTGVRRQVRRDVVRVRQQSEGLGTSTLCLDRPVVLSYAEARRSVRFDVLDPSWLGASLQIEDEKFPARVVNIGLTGVAMAFSAHPAPRTPQGVELPIRLVRQDEELELSGRLVRRKDSHQAFAFTGLRHNAPDQRLEALRKLCLQLEELGAKHQQQQGAVEAQPQRGRRR